MPIGQNVSASPTLSTTNVAYATSLVVSTRPATLYGLTGYNSKTSAQFVQVHDAVALPSNAAVPVITFTVPASSNFALDFGLRGRKFSVGITVACSSTGPTLTVGSADIWVDAQYL